MTNIFKNITSALFGAVLLCGVSSPSFAADVSPELKQTAETIVGGQINAFRTKNHEKAFGFAAPNIQNIFGSSDRFIGMVKNGYGAIYGAQRFGFGRVKIEGGALFQEVMITGPQGRDWVALYTLLKQPDGSWRIGGVQMRKADNIST